MKKFLVSLLMWSCSFCSIYAQETNLGYEQQQEFIRSKLNIEIEQTALYSYPGKQGGLGAISTLKHWQAYLGLKPISEEKFFTLTGYEKEALQARKHKEKCTIITIAGLILAVGGFAYAYDGIGEDNNKFTSGMIIGSVGSGVALGGAIGLSTNFAPYLFVRDISEEYNKKLLIQIQNKQKKFEGK